MAKVGRPRMYETPEDMQKNIDLYFTDCQKRREENPLSAPPTLSGLSYHLGFEDRESFINYANYDEFSRTVKRAKLRIENILEEMLFMPSCTGTIFNLKNNFGWKDKHEHDINQKSTVKVDAGMNATDAARAYQDLMGDD